MTSSIQHMAGHAEVILKQFLSKQRKTQRRKLALLIATMIEVRSANTMELAAALPTDTERLDMRYQWVSRFLQNEYVRCGEVMRPFAEKLLERAALQGTIHLAIDQTQACYGMQILMVSVCHQSRALPIAWIAEATEGGIGFADQKYLLDLVEEYLPDSASVMLLGDRFYGTADLISLCNQKGWDYRLRLKGNLKVDLGDESTTTGQLSKGHDPFHPDVRLTGKSVPTNLAIVREEGHTESWILAMSQKPSFESAREYGKRWSIEAMFSDFKSRGFGLEGTQLRYPDRLERLILIMALSLLWSVVAGEQDAATSSLPHEKKVVQSAFEALYPSLPEGYVIS